MSSGDLPSIIGAIALLIGGVFTGLIGLDQKRKRIDQETLEELENYHQWHPRVRRAVVLLRAAISDCPQAVEPDGIQDLIQWPPPKPKHARRGDEVTADDAG